MIQMKCVWKTETSIKCWLIAVLKCILCSYDQYDKTMTMKPEKENTNFCLPHKL